jgi:hypothetical protein
MTALVFQTMDETIDAFYDKKIKTLKVNAIHHTSNDTLYNEFYKGKELENGMFVQDIDDKTVWVGNYGVQPIPMTYKIFLTNYFKDNPTKVAKEIRPHSM